MNFREFRLIFGAVGADAVTMKLYDSKLAPNARRVRIFLAEKGMSVPMVDMDLARLDQKTTAFSVLNPFQTVPVLELDDGEVISESAAICRYFEELRPEPPLQVHSRALRLGALTDWGEWAWSIAAAARRVYRPRVRRSLVLLARLSRRRPAER